MQQAQHTGHTRDTVMMEMTIAVFKVLFAQTFDLLLDEPLQ